MKPLRKGNRGPEVRQLQEMLVASGYRIVPDEYFWNDTEAAVRAFQRKQGLIPDGIAGPNTWGALNGSTKTNSASGSFPILDKLVTLLGAPVIQAAMLARNLMASNEASKPAAQMRISEKGLQFIYTLEAFPGLSNHVHWPGGSSGVTLGPGYDMKERSETTIIADMRAIGLDTAKAEKIAKGSGLVGPTKAQEFCKANRSLVNLGVKQEMVLLRHIVPQYEGMVKRGITTNLLQNEFDALVSFAYNPGREFKNVAGLINQGKVADAMHKIKQVIKTGGKVNNGLINRRGHEVTLYLYSNYGKLRSV